MEKLLSEFDKGEAGVVKAVNGEGWVRRRLFDMGVTPGTEVIFRKRAPFGDPLLIALRGYELSLRKTEADCVVVEVTV